MMIRRRIPRAYRSPTAWLSVGRFALRASGRYVEWRENRYATSIQCYLRGSWWRVFEAYNEVADC